MDIQQYMYTVVTLDGHESKDTDDNPLTYLWDQVSGPAVTLSDSTAGQPTFIPTTPGTYVFGLTVNDGTLDSPPDLVEVSVMEPGGEFPVAEIQVNGNRATDWETWVGETLGLDGEVSGVTDEDTITWQWSQVAGVAAATGGGKTFLHSCYDRRLRIPIGYLRRYLRERTVRDVCYRQ